MTTVRIYNTLSRNVEPLQPRHDQKVSVYCCGPTVYDVPHAGHARAAVAFDVLVRHLRARGYDVTYVRNITDIDDKILARSKESGEEPLALSKRMAEVYRQQIAAVGCDRPTHEPQVSDHLPEIFEIVQKLIDQDAAYVVDMPGGTRDVYFRVRSDADYGKLSGRDVDSMMAGARVAEWREEAGPGGLRSLEGREAGRTVVGQPVGARSAGLAYRVLGNVLPLPGRDAGHSRRRPGPDLSAPRERDCSGGGVHRRQAASCATGCTTAG